MERESMADLNTTIQDIYSLLLAKDFQRQLFSELGVEHKHEGREYLAPCPFCSSERFSYPEDKPVYKCWSCGKAGDWLSYLQEKRGLSFFEALSLLADQAGVDLPQDGQQAQKSYKSYTKRADLLEAAQQLFIDTLWSPEGQGVKDYLKERGYSDGEIKEMEIGAYIGQDNLQAYLQEKDYSQAEIKASGLLLRLKGMALGESHQATLPWRDRAGRAMGFQARAIVSRDELEQRGWPAYLYSQGLKKKEALPGLSRARGSEQVILVEGPMDAKYLGAKGLPAVASGGTSISKEQLKALQQAGAKEILLALDMDEAGRKATAKAIQELRSSEMRLYVVSWPAEYKDPDELVRAKGLEAFQEALDSPDSWPRWLANYIVSQHDIQDEARRDLELDRALEQAIEVYNGIEDVIERRAFWDGLIAATGLSEEYLLPRATEAAKRNREKQQREILQATLRKAEKAAREEGLLSAENELEDGLQLLKSSRRGAKIPEPYLVEDLDRDIQETPPALPLGYESLADVVAIPQGALSVIAAQSRHGKTTFMLNLLANWLDMPAYKDKRFIFYSYEEPRRALALKLIMIWAGVLKHESQNYEAYINYWKHHRGGDEHIEKAIAKYQQLSSSGRFFISDEQPRAEDLAGSIASMGRTGKVGAIIVDYIQVIPLLRPMAGQRYLEIQKVAQLLREQAVEHNLAIVTGAQLNRTPGQERFIQLGHLREAGDIGHEANLVIGLYLKAAGEEEQDGYSKEREV